MMPRFFNERRNHPLAVTFAIGCGLVIPAAAQMRVPANSPPKADAPAATAPAAAVSGAAAPSAQSVPDGSKPDASAAGANSAPETQKLVVPAGTKVLLSLKNAINTKTARPGDGIYLVSSFPVVVGGHVVIPPGVYVTGVVDRVKRPGKVKGRAEIGLHFTSIIFPDGKVVPIPGSVNSLPGSTGPAVKDSEGTVEQAGSKGHDAGTVAKGAGIGSSAGGIVGGVGGHWGEGLGYGALAGAGAGAIYTMFSRGPDIVIPEGASVEMVLQRPLLLEPQQYGVVHDQPVQSAPYTPAPQARPLPKPE